MQTGRSASLRHRVRTMHSAGERLGRTNPFLLCGTRHVAVKGFVTRGLERSRPATGQKDVTAELIERAFALALSTRLKQHSGIHVDVRSTAWGLIEGKFGGMTVRGYNWRTPLELTAQQIMVDVGELILDYQRLLWQQMVALKNVPQGSVAFTLTSLDLANFMVHPLMVAAAAGAVKGHAFSFDRSTASVRLDPATGRGVITYEGVWAYDGQRYAITMCTPPGRAAAEVKGAAGVHGSALSAAAAAGPSGGGVGSVAASSNTLEQLTVSARRIAPPGRSTTGSYASLGSMDEPLAAVAAVPVAAAITATAAVGSMRSGSSQARLQTVKTVATPTPYSTTAPGDAGAAVLSSASACSMDTEDAAVDAGAQVVAEGLRRFFSSLVLNLQGIELRNPVLLVQLPGPGVGAAAVASRNSSQPALSPAASSGSASGKAPGAAAALRPADPSGPASLQPALLTITMKIAILQLPPLNMKF